MRKGSKMTMEQRRHISQGQKGKKLTVEHRNKISRGLTLSTVVRERKGRPSGISATSKEWVAFRDQRLAAKQRGVEWRFSFNEWLSLWESSGRFHLRGRLRGCYVMARYGDVGAYEIGNVEIASVSKNGADAHTGNKYNLGRKHSEIVKLERSKKLKRFWNNASHEKHLQHSAATRRGWEKRRDG
jgi:hypothetical protein